MRSILLAFAIVLRWIATAQAVEPFPEDCKLVRQASLPFTADRGHIMVDMAVNGHPLRFMVDTGGVFSAISNEAAQAIGLHPAPLGQAFRIRDAGGAEVSHIARIEYITLAQFRSENLTLMISDLPQGEDGVLAPELLRNFDIELDFATRTMNLFKRPRCSEHVVYWTDDFVKLPMRVTTQGHIQIPVTVNDQAIKATIDTGSPVTLIGDNAAKAIIGEGKETGRAFALSGGSGGKVSGSGIAPDSLIIGKFKWVSPTLISTPNKTGWHSDGSEMLLGLDILHDLHVFIDYRGEQLYVSKR
ncbi:MAG TPA: pepsin/retropepsin-like aspartic protease family protein [Rhizomicrobium sp.]|nr:pepsin/retropepsin-like aspartic protease family protein [Rhizomicrobium sp.]